MHPIEVRPKVTGRYIFKKTNRVTGKEVHLTERAENLLLEPFFRDALSNRNPLQGYLSGIVVGSGNTPPVVTNTSLENFVAGSVTQQGPALPNVVNSTVFPRYVTRRFTKRFSGATIANIPLSEVGVCITPSQNTNPTASTPLASRALITDSMGSPASIVVNSDEFLDVTYEMTTYALDGVTGSFNINVLGTVESFGYEIRPVCMLNEASWASAAFTSNVANVTAKSYPSIHASSTAQGSSAQSTSEFEDPSSSAQPVWGDSSGLFTSYKETPQWDSVSMTAAGILNLPLNNGNYPGGIRSFLLNFAFSSPPGNRILGVHRMVLDRPLMKTSDHIFEFPITMGMNNAQPPGM